MNYVFKKTSCISRREQQRGLAKIVPVSRRKTRSIRLTSGSYPRRNFIRCFRGVANPWQGFKGFIPQKYIRWHTVLVIFNGQQHHHRRGQRCKRSGNGTPKPHDDNPCTCARKDRVANPFAPFKFVKISDNGSMGQQSKPKTPQMPSLEYRHDDRKC